MLLEAHRRHTRTGGWMDTQEAGVDEHEPYTQPIMYELGIRVASALAALTREGVLLET